MNHLKTWLRWCALPFVFVGAILLAFWLWSTFPYVSAATCSPPLEWGGSAPPSVKCSLRLVARVLLDIGGASMPGLMAVFLCAAVAPARRPATACVAALGVCAVGLAYGLFTASLRSPMKLTVRADLVAIFASPWLTVWLVAHLDRLPKAGFNPPWRPAGSQSRARS